MAAIHYLRFGFCFQRLVREVKQLIKEQRAKGKTGPIRFDDEEVSEAVTERLIRKKMSSISAIRESGLFFGGASQPAAAPPPPKQDGGSGAGGLFGAIDSLAWEKDIDLTKGAKFAKADAIEEVDEATEALAALPNNNSNANNSANKQQNGAKQPPGKKLDNKNLKTGNKVSPAPSKSPSPDQGFQGDAARTGSADSNSSLLPSHGNGGKRPQHARDNSGGSKDSAYDEGKPPLAAKPAAKSRRRGGAVDRTSLTSASSLTSLLHAVDGKKEKERDTEF